MGRDSRSNIRSHAFNRPMLPVLVKDALGRTLTEGDLGLLQPLSGHLSFRIAGITRELDPRAPANSVRVTLAAEIPMGVTTGGMLPVILIVPQGGQDEPPASIATNEQANENGGPTLTLTDGEVR